jgi:hypothetical protein
MNERGLPIRSADLILTPDEMQRMLERPISWDPKADQPVSLRRFIAERLPNAAPLYGVSAEVVEEPIPSLSELTQEDQKKLVKEMVRQGDEDTELATISDGSFSIERQLQEIENGSAVGTRLVSTLMHGNMFLVGMFESGSVKVDPNKKVQPIEFPDFLF